MRVPLPHLVTLALLLLAGCAARPGFTALGPDGATDFLPFRGGGGVLIGPGGATVVSTTRGAAWAPRGTNYARGWSGGELPGPGGATALLGF